ncbi:MAG: hypothetical protein NVS9B10_13370 [Nevskia sp.]
MAELLFGAVLVLLLLRLLSQGEPIEFEDLLGIPQLIALALVALLLVLVFTRSATVPPRGMAGIATAGLIMVLFPERMPDTARGGTLMTAFWSLFGWLMIGLAYAAVLIL